MIWLPSKHDRNLASIQARTDMLIAVGYHQKDVKTKAYIMLNDALEVAIATERSFVFPPITRKEYN